MGTSEPGKRAQPAANPAVGETRHAAPASEPEPEPGPAPGPPAPGAPPAAPRPRSGAEDTVPAASGPADGWTVAADPPPEPARASVRVDRYVFGEELGRGGMGRVVEATDTRLGRKVAVKEALPRGLDLRRRFEREVRITARLEHPSIVPLYDAGLSPDGNPFYVMRKVSGRPLDRMIADARTLGDRLTLLPHLLAAIDAIAHAHTREVVHRDMKPANVLIGEHGETVVIDWGLAKALGEEDDDPVDTSLAPSDAVETQIGAVFGTPGFMAPEQARGEPLDPRSDVYALGATLYQLLSGRPPHSGTTATEVIDRSLAERPPPLSGLVPGVPAELVAIADKALAYDRASRYPDAGALAEDVRRFLTGQLVAAHRYTTRQRITRFVRRHRAAVAIGSLATVALVVGGTLSVRGIMTERDRAMHAEQDANRARAAAELARDREADRADELLVTQARALVDVNPTAALAALKLVKPTSRRLRSARMVAMSAAARGVAWGYPGHGRMTASLEIAADGRRLLSAGEEHGFRIHDLDRHEELLAVDFPSRVEARWVANDTAVLVAPQTGGLVIFDAVTGARRPIAWAPGHHAVALDATETGDRVFLHDEQGALSVVDVAAGTVAPVPVAAVVDDLAVAPDGSWLVLGTRDKGELQIVRTADRAVMARMPGQVSWAVTSADGRRAAAVVDARAVLIQVTGDRATITPVEPVRAKGNFDYPTQMMFRGDDVLITRLTSRVDLVHPDGSMREFMRTRQPLMMGAEGRGDVVVWGDLHGQLVIADHGRMREVRAPAEVQLKLIAARPESRHVAIATDELILVWDLDRITPTQLAVPGGSQNLGFRDNDTLLVTPHNDTWRLLDLRSGEVTKLGRGPVVEPIIRMAIDRDRRILVEQLGRGLALIRPDTTAIEQVADGPVEAMTLLSGDRFAYGTADGKLVVGTGRADRRVVLTAPAPIAGIAAAGDGLVALIADDTVVRLDGAGRELARIALPAPAGGGIAVDAAGMVLIGVDNRVMRWNGARLDDLATLDSPVVALVGSAVGMVASTRAGNIYRIDDDGGAHRVLARTQHSSTIARDASVLLSQLADGQLVVVDLATTERAVLPTSGLMMSPTISDDARRVVYLDGEELSLWTLDAPTEREPDAWLPWLEQLTNARPSTAPDVVWPWQVP